MGQIVRAIAGMGEACRALDFPVVSGNVSLYNETNGAAIPPTPTVGAVGLIPDYAQSHRLRQDARRRHPGADRRDARRAGRQPLPARGARGRRSGARRVGPAARRPRRREAARRSRPRPDPRGPPARRARPLRRRPGRRGGGDGAGLGRRRGAARQLGRPRPRLPVRRGPGPLPAGHAGPASACWSGRARSACGPATRAMLGGEAFASASLFAIALADLRQAHEGWMPGFMDTPAA